MNYAYYVIDDRTCIEKLDLLLINSKLRYELK